MKAIETRLKPFYGLSKIAKKRELASPAVFHKDNTIIYKFCNDYVYAEFTINNSYPSINDDNVHYCINTTFQEKFYTEGRMKVLANYFDLQSTFEATFVTKHLLRELRDIKNVDDTKSKDLIDLKFVVDSDYNHSEVYLGHDSIIDQRATIYSRLIAYNGLNNPCEDKQYDIRVNKRYLKLALSHGYRLTTISFSGSENPLLFYSYEDYNTRQDENFRMLVMPIKFTES